MPIRVGVGIGPINLGMSGQQVRRALGRPTDVLRRRVIRGQPYVELQWGFGTWDVGLYGQKGNRRVVLVRTGLARHRTPERLGVGSTHTQVLRLPGVRERRCEKPTFWVNWYLRRGSTELVFHPGTRREVTAVDVRATPVLGCVTP